MPSEKTACESLIHQFLTHKKGAGCKLVDMGESAVRPILVAMGEPAPHGVHPVDVIEDLGDTLWRIAKEHPRALIQALESEELAPDPFLWVICGALGSNKSDRTINALIKAAKHKNQYVRCSAVGSLANIRAERCIEPVVDAIRDRAFGVRMIAIEAITKDEFFRTPRAIESLRRVVRYKAPGSYPAKALKKLEQAETQADTVDTDFSRMQISSKEVAALSKMTSVRRINLNGAAGFNNSTFAKLKNRFPKLQYLDLSDTGITGAGLKYLVGSPHLKCLLLENVELSRGGLQHLKHLKLEVLDLEGTNVRDAQLANIRQMTSLRTLVLDWAISDVGLKNITRLKHLEHFSITLSRATDNGMQYLGGLHELRSIAYGSSHGQYASGDKTTGSGLVHFRNLKQLEFLDLSGNSVRSAHLKHLKPLRKLRRLKLKFTSIDDAAIEFLSALNLEELDLSGTQLTDAALPRLCQMKSLNHICLRQTKISRRGKQELKQALAGCRVDGGAFKGIRQLISATFGTKLGA